MISDVLSAALDDVAEYQRKYPHVYREAAMAMDEWEKVTRRVLRDLDRAPEGCGRYAPPPDAADR